MIRDPRNRRSWRTARRGLGLPELLISLTISSLVLTAVALAWVSSSRIVEQNDQFFRASQAARVCVNQIMTEARRCQSGVVESDSLELTLYSGEKRTYALDNVNRQLTMTLNSLLVPQTYVMARNVSNAQFTTDGTTITLTMTVQVGANRILMNGSALPRRRVVYK
ncbi:MAG: prepilin-type N-terminal cleavage/methylation domain-containing protein [Anaerolineae bacterium]|nr:prepilin-type N-terminal cleavage/methylation domain-containing protein [Phycisphaerae bacterium]